MCSNLNIEICDYIYKYMYDKMNMYIQYYKMCMCIYIYTYIHITCINTLSTLDGSEAISLLVGISCGYLDSSWILNLGLRTNANHHPTIIRPSSDFNPTIVPPSSNVHPPIIIIIIIIITITTIIITIIILIHIIMHYPPTHPHCLGSLARIIEKDAYELLATDIINGSWGIMHIYIEM